MCQCCFKNHLDSLSQVQPRSESVEEHQSSSLETVNLAILSRGRKEHGQRGRWLLRNAIMNNCWHKTWRHALSVCANLWLCKMHNKRNAYFLIAGLVLGLLGLKKNSGQRAGTGLKSQYRHLEINAQRAGNCYYYGLAVVQPICRDDPISKW